MSDMFLTKDELVILTGRKLNRLQIEQLRKMRVPFFVNAVNAPVVARIVIEGRPVEPAPKKKWRSNAIDK